MLKDCLIILSGGMDSVTLLHQYKDRIALALTFDYGSNHNQRETQCAAQQCQMLNIPHIVIPLEFMHKYFNSSLLQGPDAIPQGHYADDNMKSTVVPFRNGIMLAVACGMAASRGLKHLLIANHGGDHAIYPDCRPEFIDAMCAATAAGTYEGIDIIAPYTNISKGEIALRGKELGVDYAKTYSCYKGGEKHCGRCATCVERREAMLYAGIPDPTKYE